ncbi:hypothetical protein CJ030_MR3G011089 [Morella rubra]|uniref:Uncharacterized protein n=1 Tax=Morella rubra TaxID=262757 RepID=A0A6A1W363_9ROSI|nr:hypothetical protein CJ030_MR3G011089 [Morella rubra]
MRILLLNQRAFMATPLILRSVARWASLSFFSSSDFRWEGGVSMVQGASRGIGLEFVKQLLEKNEKGHVVATCRNPDSATGLLSLKNKFSERLSIQKLDLTLESTIEVTSLC